MKRFEIEAQLNDAVKSKSWFVRQVWPLIKDFIIDIVWALINKRNDNNNGNAEQPNS